MIQGGYAPSRSKQYATIPAMIPASLTLAAAHDALATRQMSSLELTDWYLERIAQYDPRLNTFITVTAESAREQAQRADDERARGIQRGALHGIPLALKDLYDVRGVPTTAGSKILRDNIATRDAEVVTRLRSSGAVLLGKNNMHEFAYGVTNENPHHGNVRNPWNPEHITGGSSGGGAAAVAAGLCLAALGSDTGGSIRIPAALCGISGLKPTFGRVSLRGVIPLSWNNDHAGPLAQTAQDCALLLDAIAGFDADDPGSANVPAGSYTAALNDSLRGLRFAAPRGYFEASVSDEILRAVRTGERLLQDLGAELVEIDIPGVEAMFHANRLILRVDAATYHREWLETRPNEYGADVFARLNTAQQISAPEYALARRNQTELRRALESLSNRLISLSRRRRASPPQPSARTLSKWHSISPRSPHPSTSQAFPQSLSLAASQTTVSPSVCKSSDAPGTKPASSKSPTNSNSPLIGIFNIPR